MPDTATKEHPITFNEWSIRRILAGEKTQTRRLTGLSEINDSAVTWDGAEMMSFDMTQPKALFGRVASNGAVIETEVDCPYGQPGDALWVREAFRLPKSLDDISPSEAVKRPPDGKEDELVKYCADGEDRTWYDAGIEMGRKRPSIHMPRELCRLRLRVEDVRVEPVQEISNDDARAEGVDPNTPVYDYSAREKFAHRWNAMLVKDAWRKNPWVWVISFTRIDNN